MKYIFIFCVLLVLIMLFMPYFNPQELQTSLFFDLKYHFLGFILGLCLILLSIKNGLFNVSQFSNENILINYFEKGFFIFFIPIILSIPTCIFLNQFLDSSEATSVTGKAVSFEYLTNKKLKTRKCSVNVQTNDKNYVIFYRPETALCSDDIINKELSLELRSGFLSKTWLSGLKILDNNNLK